MKVSKVKVSNMLFFWRAQNKVLNFWMQATSIIRNHNTYPITCVNRNDIFLYSGSNSNKVRHQQICKIFSRTNQAQKHSQGNENLKLIDQLTWLQSFHSQGYSFILVVVRRFMWKKSTWFTQFFTQWVPPWSWMVQWFTWYSNLVGDYG